ncbi:MAG: hypothetical protein Q8K05_08545 [Polaromonas sp.]|uniref:hypothetical protein n=1 Tax=Polaromonas sp. TaxID=1869339 RepID=UPI002731657E|nr:hypothetical protein [Polaromonas sp.]MDP2256088.1 hypothetical protein [Polaromonas sp.]MDP3605497.1 hypothetical protein [Polaromonas sp.]
MQCFRWAEVFAFYSEALDYHQIHVPRQQSFVKIVACQGKDSATFLKMPVPTRQIQKSSAMQVASKREVTPDSSDTATCGAEAHGGFTLI